MSGLLLLVAAQAAMPPPVEEEIVVLGQKLETTRFLWKASDKSGSWKLTSCKIKKSSGDKDVDAITCRAVAECLPTLPLNTKRLPTAFSDCLTERRSKLIEALARHRAAAMDPAL
jgi:hypothetical protein